MSILDDKKVIHFIGCGGSGMFPIIQILNGKGYTITGSDVNEGDIINYERNMGIKVTIPHNPLCVEGADLVVYSAAIFKDNCELARAKELNIPCIERSVMLGQVCRLFPKSICVSGTHGKTTTTSLLSQILIMADKDPACVIGGKLPLIDGYGKDGKGENIVIEACEYSYTFLELLPYMAIVLNIDHDHLEFFKTFENLKNSFYRFTKLATGSVILNGDDCNTLDAIKQLDVPVITFGIENNCDYVACNIRKEHKSFYSFDVQHNGQIIATVHLSIPGRHNIYNATAAFAAAHQLGISADIISQAIGKFGGAGRRFEIHGTVNGVTIADDYAHHPEEITATLNAAKDMGFNKVWAVFQPFTYSRTKMLLDDFAKSLQIADHVVMTEIMGSREVNTIGIYTKDLAEKIPGSVWFDSFDKVKDYVMSHAESGDLVITMGCGDVYKIAKSIIADSKQ